MKAVGGGAPLALLVLVVLASGAPARAQTEACDREGGKVIRASRRARVFRIGDHVYACLLNEERVRLGRASDSPRLRARTVRRFRLRGPFVAVESKHAYRRSTAHYVDVILLYNGQEFRSVPTGGEPTGQGVGPTTDLVLASNGSIAWIAENVSSQPRTYEVHEDDYQERDTTLVMSGPDIDPRSLVLRRGFRAEWSRAGQKHSHVLD